jgi:hypothetical protein
MPVNFFLGRPEMDGCILDLAFNSKDEGMYLGFCTQTGWDKDKQFGLFAGGQKLRFFLNKREMIMLRSALITNKNVEFTHTYNNINSTLKYIYNNENNRGGLLFIKDSVKLKALIDDYDAIQIRMYIEHAFDRIFTAIYAADKKSWEESQKQKLENNNQNDKIDNKEDDNIPF